MKIHKLLARAINKHPIEGLSESQNLSFQKLISEINQIYIEAENDLAFLEHTTEVSSEELIEKNHEIREQYTQIEQQRLHLMASSKMSSLGEMASGIAHEINNPLAIIKLYVEQIGHLIQRTPTNSTLILKLTEDISTTVMRIAKIISGLRNFARDGSYDSTKIASVTSIIESTLPFCKERFKQYGVDLQLNCPPQISLHCRAIQISQILLNLLNNSHDAISNLDNKWIRITVVERDEFVEIIVSDSGPGLSEDLRNKIFQPFFTTKGTNGTGIGLSISLGLAMAHGGSLTYRKAENTTFVLSLPKILSKLSNE